MLEEDNQNPAGSNTSFPSSFPEKRRKLFQARGPLSQIISMENSSQRRNTGPR